MTSIPADPFAGQLTTWTIAAEVICPQARPTVLAGLAEAADPDTLLVDVSRDAYRTRLARRTAVPSYGGFTRALCILCRAGLLNPIEGTDTVQLTFPDFP